MISKNVLSLRTFFEIILDNNATKFGSKRFARNVDSDYLPHNIPDSELGHGVIFIVHQSLHCLRKKLSGKLNHSFHAIHLPPSLHSPTPSSSGPMPPCFHQWPCSLSEAFSFCLLQYQHFLVVTFIPSCRSLNHLVTPSQLPISAT